MSPLLLRVVQRLRTVASFRSRSCARANQTPFFFGGSQIPTDLFLSKAMYNGSSGSGLHKGKNHCSPSDFEMVFSRRHSCGSGFHLGSMSKTHLGDLDFTTKRGDKVFHRKGHNIKLSHTMPFMKQP